jgi:hypothetical protein
MHMAKKEKMKKNRPYHSGQLLMAAATKPQEVL